MSNYPTLEFLKELETLSQHDRQEIETFIGYLKSRPQKLTTIATDLVEKVNNKLLEGYVELTVDFIDYDDNYEYMFLYFVGRERPVSFPVYWFTSCPKLIDIPLFAKCLDRDFFEIFVKFRPDGKRIDKVAIESKYLSEKGKIEGKKRILVIDSPKSISTNIPQVTTQTEVVTTPIKEQLETLSSAAQFVKDLLTKESTFKVDDKFITASISKTNPIFKDLSYFLDGRHRLIRVAAIIVDFISKMSSNCFTWDSEYFYAQKHDFSYIKRDNPILLGQKIKVVAHFRPNDFLEIVEYILNDIDADILLSVLVEETDTEYKVTLCGWVYKDDFIAKTKPWSYDERTKLRFMEISELNSAQELF